MLFCVVDIEAEGLSRESNVLEFSYATVDTEQNMKIVDHDTLWFYKEHFNVEEAQHIHGLTRDFLRSKCPDNKTFNDNLAKMCSVLTNARIVTKNGRNYDMKVIDSFKVRYLPTTINLGFKPAGVFDISDYIGPVWRDMLKARPNTLECARIFAGKLGNAIAEKLAITPGWESTLMSVKPTSKWGTLEENFALCGFTKEQVLSLGICPTERSAEHCAAYDVGMTYLVFIFCMAAKHIGG